MATKGKKLSDRSIKLIGEKLKQIPKPSFTGPAKGGGSNEAFWGKLGDEDPANPGRFKWTYLVFNKASWDDRSPAVAAGASYTARELNGAKGPMLVGKRVQLWNMGPDADGNLVFIFNRHQGVFSVVLEQDGGADGNSPSTPASWTYTVKDETGTTTLKKNNAGDDATAMSPDMARLCAKTNKATRGLARYKDDGTLVVVWADETPAYGRRGC